MTAYTGGRNVPSARFRVRQYIPALKRFGVEMREAPARFGAYPPAVRAARPAWGLAAVAERALAAALPRGSALTLLQREMISTFATVERLTRAPRVLDVDDALWLLRGGRCAVSLARLCDAVICGNETIGEFFRKHARRIAVLPTAVDTERFRPGRRGPDAEAQVICWSGTRSGLRYLAGIETALAKVLSARRGRRLRIVCDARPRLDAIAPEQIEFVPWSEEAEVPALQDAAAAIMPLDDSEWARGKCGYKLLTYMACGVAVVASPEGMNAEILSRGSVGYAARTRREWEEGLEAVLEDPERARSMGACGREVVVRHYSVEALAPALAAILLSVAGGAN